MNCRHFAAAFSWLVLGYATLVTPARAETVILVDGSTQMSIGRGTSSLWGSATVYDDASGIPRQVFLVNDRLQLYVGETNFTQIRLDLPTGTRFAPGTYPGATADNSSIHSGDPTDRSAIDVGIHSSACNSAEGWIKIYESDIGPDDSVGKLALDFLHWCDDDLAPLFVAVRINSAIPLTRPQPYAVAGRMQHAGTGETVTLDALDSYSYTSSSLSYLWEQIEGPAVQLSNAQSRTTQFEAPTVPVGGLPLRFRLTVTDAEGESDTDVVTVQAHHLSDPRTRVLFHSRIGDPVFEYWRIQYALDPHFEDTQDLVQVFSEGDLSALGWLSGSYGARIDYRSSFRPRRDRGIEVAAVTGLTTGVFQAPAGSSPALGRYENAQAFSQVLTTIPYMQFGGFGTSCGEVVGAFDILELEVGPPDHVNGMTTLTKAAIDFEQHCATFSATPAITGSMRLNSAIPLHDGLEPALPSPSPTMVQLTISPNPATVDQTVTFTWSSTNANYCMGFNGFPQSGALPTSGIVTSEFSAATEQEFSVRCATSNSFADEYETLEVRDAPPPPPPPPPPGSGGGGGSVGFAELLAMILGIGLIVCRRREIF